MTPSLSTWSSLSTPVKLISGLMAGAGVVGIAGLAGGTGLAMVVGGGLIVLLLILLLVRMIFLAIQRRKEKAISKEMGEAGPSAGPTTAEERAQQEELRRRFLEGIDKFRAAGNNLYTMPWYLVLGEPGSGKTEAIRRCGIGFPPGLQDERQGWKGTVTMDWWFTNRGIFLDTAGRYTTETDNPAELTQLLKLLRKHRGNCPINGIILIVPANSLIQDSDAEIERKAGRIAQRLELIKRTLEVRFPVYFVVTKTDLIESFRWFFEGLDDPQLQHQVFGWGKPGSLDEPFKPEDVDQYLDHVRQRLLQRRMALLADAGTGEDEHQRRIDRMDALYIFPDDLMRLAPRLKRYMELIFTPNPWSGKPSFFRGIFFTSSMRDGTALDQELAEALDVPVDSLPEGRVWDKEKPYFLRDLFNRKIFPEQGLVTRASDVGRMRRRRRGMLLGTGIAGVVALIALTVFSASDLERRIGEQTAFWGDLQEGYRAAVEGDDPWRVLVRTAGERPQYQYFGSFPRTVGNREVPLNELLHESERHTRAPIERPAMFFWARGGNVLETERRQAHRRLMDAVMLAPLTDATAANLLADAPSDAPRRWSHDQTPAEALGVAMRFYSGARLDQLDLNPLFDFILEDEEYERYRPDRERLNEAFIATYAGEDSPPVDWPAMSDRLVEAIKAGVDAVNAYWAERASEPPQLDDDARQTAAKVHELSEALAAFREAESQMLALGEPVDYDPATIDTADRVEDIHQVWLEAHRALADSLERIEAAKAGLEVALDRTDELVEAAKRDMEAEADRTYDHLLACLGEENEHAESRAQAHGQMQVQLASAGGNPAEREAQIESLVERLKSGRQRAHEAMADYLDELHRNLDAAERELRPLDGNEDEYAFALRARLYSAVHDAVSRDVEGVDLEPRRIQRLLESLASAMAEARETSDELIDALPTDSEDGDLADRIQRGVRYMLDFAQRRQRIVLMEQALDQLPRRASAIDELVSDELEQLAESPPRLRPVPLSRGMGDADGAQIRPEFTPEAVEKAMGRWLALRTLLETEPNNDDPDDPSEALLAGQRESLSEVESAWRGFAERYLDYWLDSLPEKARIDADPERGWSGLRDELLALQATAINAALDRLASRRNAALRSRVLPEALLDSDQQRRLRDAREALAEERDRLGSDRFEERCRGVVRRWRDLPADATAAARIIRGLRAEDFRDDFSVYGQSHWYWDELNLHALGLIAREAESDAVTALDTLRELDRFPLRRDATRALTEDELREARKAIAHLPASPDRGDGGRDRIIGAGGRTGESEIDDLLARLRGERVIPDPERPWLEQITALIGALTGTREDVRWLSADLTFPGVEAGDDIRRHFVEFSLQVGDADPSRRQRVTSPDLEKDITAPGQRVQLLFYEHPDQEESRGQSLLGDDWPLLRPLLLEHADRDDDEPKRWRIDAPVEHETHDEPIGRFPVHIKFNRVVPTPDDWPTRETWPEP